MTIADIETLARFLTKTNTTSYTAAQMLINVNAEYERIRAKILRETAGSQMQGGELNRTAFPTFTVTMSNGVKTYDLRDWLTTTNQQTLAQTTPLLILGAGVLDQDGNEHPLTRTSFRKIQDEGGGYGDYQSTSGLPSEYEMRDNLVVLQPAPDNGVSVTLTNGLLLYHLPSAEIYTSAEQTTGTKEPGFIRSYHHLLSYGAARVYAIANGLPNANLLKAETKDLEKEMFEFIGVQDQDSRPIMSNKGINYI